jgi:hypothetical protein
MPSPAGERSTIPAVSDTANPNPNPDWYPDPTGRFEQRYWDGSQWTEHVTSAGQQRTDPLPGGPVEPATTADLPGLQATAPDPAPDWYPDPTGRYEQRYWDGSQWTEHVTAAGQQGVDPLPEADPADEGDDIASAAAAAVDAAAASAGAEVEESDEVNPFAAASEPAPRSNPSGDYTLNGEGQLVNREAQVTPAADAAAAPGPPPDWYPDPSGRQELRYWDGSQWTEHASTAGRQVVDPLG